MTEPTNNMDYYGNANPEEYLTTPGKEMTYLLSDKELKDWVFERTGNTFLYDHERGVLKDLIAKAEPLIRAEVLKEVGKWLEKRTRGEGEYIGVKLPCIIVDFEIATFKSGKMP